MLVLKLDGALNTPEHIHISPIEPTTQLLVSSERIDGYIVNSYEFLGHIIRVSVVSLEVLTGYLKQNLGIYFAHLGGKTWIPTTETAIAEVGILMPKFIETVQPPLAKFELVGAAQTFSYNDGQGSRDRLPKLLLFARNFVVEFHGFDIPNMCTVVGEQYTKSGKWSNTTYDIVLADGVHFASLRQDWDSGCFINNLTSPKAMMDDLKLEGVMVAEGKRFIQTFMKNSWAKHEALLDSLETLETAQVVETIQYKFEFCRVNARTGMTYLVIDGEVWNENMPEKVVIMSKQSVSGRGGGSVYYDLVISSACQIEEVTEYAPYNDGADSLQGRGFIYDDNNRTWTKPEAPEGNTPFAGLFGKVS